MKQIVFLIVSGFLISSVACVQQDNTAPSENPQATTEPVKGQSAVKDDVSQKNILQIAMASPDHTTLATAIKAAALEDVLTNAGPLTVFAPNNAAFGKLPAGTVENLLKEENKSTLARIIKNHASPGTYKVDDLKNNQQLFMATGVYVKVERKDDGVYVGGAKILGSVPASNGIIHVVDSVILPPAN